MRPQAATQGTKKVRVAFAGTNKEVNNDQFAKKFMADERIPSRDDCLDLDTTSPVILFFTHARIQGDVK